MVLRSPTRMKRGSVAVTTPDRAPSRRRRRGRLVARHATAMTRTVRRIPDLEATSAVPSRLTVTMPE